MANTISIIVNDREDRRRYYTGRGWNVATDSSIDPRDAMEFNSIQEAQDQFPAQRAINYSQGWRIVPKL